MDAGKIRLVELINASKRTFNIPVYQRNYDWKPEQCKRLFLDIENVVRADYEVEHFLGTIVYVVVKSSPTFTEYILIDGQQRITSIILFIKALHDAMDEVDIRQDILETFLTNRNAPEKFRVKLKSIASDREAFHQVMNNETINADSNIIRNYNLFMQLINGSKFTPNELYAALNFIDIVYIALEKGKKSENPQMIFESLNSTGLSLTQADLIRNFLLMNHSVEKQEQLYTDHWLKIEELLTNANISDFTRDFLTLKTGKIPIKSNVYNDFKEYVYSNKTLDEEGVLEDLLIYAKYYSWFLFCRSEYPLINDLLLQFQQLKSTVIYPTLLDLFEDCFEYKIIDVTELVKILKIFVSYLYRRIVCDYKTNALNKIFASFPNEFKVSKKETYFEKVLDVLMNKSGMGIFPRNEEFKNAFITKNFYNTKIHKYTLYEIEKANNKEIIDLSKDITTEHIMPQTLTPVWKNDLGKHYDEIHSEYLGNIGNLTLTGYNGNLSNRSFQDKKEILINSNISISRSVNNYELWNEISIKDRANYLYKLVENIWFLPEEYNKPISGSREISYDVEYILTDEINVTGETPRKLIILDMEYSVSSWRDVIRTICEELYYLDKETFHSLTRHKDFEGKAKRRIDMTDENMGNSYKIAENLFVDIHGSAVELLNYSILIAEKFNVENDISYVLKQKYN